MKGQELHGAPLPMLEPVAGGFDHPASPKKNPRPPCSLPSTPWEVTESLYRANHTLGTASPAGSRTEGPATEGRQGRLGLAGRVLVAGHSDHWVPGQLSTHQHPSLITGTVLPGLGRVPSPARALLLAPWVPRAQPQPSVPSHLAPGWVGRAVVGTAASRIWLACAAPTEM